MPCRPARKITTSGPTDHTDITVMVVNARVSEPNQLGVGPPKKRSTTFTNPYCGSIIRFHSSASAYPATIDGV